MIISLIAAVSENGVIGKDNDLPWHLPADMKHFRDTTMGHCVIMGRKNYDSIPLKYRPLDGRTNIVVTRNTKFEAPGCVVVHDIEKAIEYARSQNEKEAFIIGGADVYKQTIDRADKIYFTRVHQTIDGDAFFPEVDQEKFELKACERYEADAKNKIAHSYCLYKRKS